MQNKDNKVLKSTSTLTKPHLQNKDKSGGLEVLQEFGHNENEEGSNEDPGVNSDNEEDDEFKVLFYTDSCKFDSWQHNLINS